MYKNRRNPKYGQETRTIGWEIDRNRNLSNKQPPVSGPKIRFFEYLKKTGNIKQSVIYIMNEFPGIDWAIIIGWLDEEIEKKQRSEDDGR